LAVFERVAEGPAAVHQIAKAFPVSRPAIRNICASSRMPALSSISRLETGVSTSATPMASKVYAPISIDSGLTRSNRSRLSLKTPNRKTKVELEHRHFERHGESGERLRTAVEKPEGWSYVLENFAKASAIPAIRDKLGREGVPAVVSDETSCMDAPARASGDRQAPPFPFVEQHAESKRLPYSGIIAEEKIALRIKMIRMVRE
jgi:hypothetical protein